MCLISKNPRQIATEDITVYKLLHKCGDNLIISEYGWKDDWVIGETYYDRIQESTEFTYADGVAGDVLAKDGYWAGYDKEAQNEWMEKKGYKVYGQGFHAAMSLDRYKGANMEAIIPKGSEYILDDSGLVISSAIKLIGFITKSSE